MQGEDLLPLLRKLQSIGDPTAHERRAQLYAQVAVLEAAE